jgi:hypothetical protein
MKFLREYAYTKASNVKKEVVVSYFTKELSEIESNCGNSDRGMCVLAIYRDKKSKESMVKTLKTVGENFLKEGRFKFYYVNEKAVKFSNLFSEPEEIPGFFVIKG